MAAKVTENCMNLPRICSKWSRLFAFLHTNLEPERQLFTFFMSFISSSLCGLKSNLCQWIEECRQCRHWEIVYCWAKLASDHAFHFVAFTQKIGLEHSSKAEKMEQKMDRKNSERTRLEPVYESESFKNALENLKRCHNRYSSMKKAILGNDDRVFDSGLSSSTGNFPEVLNSYLDTPFTGMDGPSGNLLSDQHGVSIGQRRKQLIEKSFGDNSVSVEATEDDEDEVIKVESSDESKNSSNKKTSKKKNSKRSKKLNTVEVDMNQDLRSLVKELAAVREDPSLVECLNEPSTFQVLNKKKKKK